MMPFFDLYEIDSVEYDRINAELRVANDLGKETN